VKRVKNPHPLGLNAPHQWAIKPTRKESAINIAIQIGKTKILGIFMISFHINTRITLNNFRVVPAHVLYNFQLFGFFHVLRDDECIRAEYRAF